MKASLSFPPTKLVRPSVNLELSFLPSGNTQTVADWEKMWKQLTVQARTCLRPPEHAGSPLRRLPQPVFQMIKSNSAFAGANRLLARMANVAAQEANVEPFRLPTGEQQTTLGCPVIMTGVGLHGGEEALVRLLPAGAGEGRYFVRKASPGSELEERIPAAVEHVCETRLSTSLGLGAHRLHTVEHLLSALEGMGVDNVRMEVEGGAEMPILDGSAQLWVEAIEMAGVTTARDAHGRSAERLRLAPQQPITVQHGDSFVAAFPSKVPLLTYGIDFPQLPVVGRQWYTWSPGGCSRSYKEEVAAARTFGILEQLEQLRAAGFIKGGSLENALVCSMQSGWVNPPLRFSDEPCRHKLLDLLGDLALCGAGGHPGLPLAHVVAFKASHDLHVKFGAALLAACRGQAHQDGRALT